MSDPGPQPQPGPQPDPVLDEAALRRVTELMYRWTGMTFGESKRYYIERRVFERVHKSRAGSLGLWLALLANDPHEREALINSFTINETYFFREEHQLAALSREMLPEIARTRRPGDKIRIWSMPCSTGEEPYSIAIWLLEHWPLVDAYNIEIVGSDIDTAAIAAARAGRYAARALAKLPPQMLESYFEPERGHRRKIIDDLRESVQFSAVNLVDPASVQSQGRFDVILCRNLLIYFDDASRDVAAQNLYEALNPGGFLCLGHSESMARISDRFDFVRLEDAIVYRRP